MRSGKNHMGSGMAEIAFRSPRDNAFGNLKMFGLVSAGEGSVEGTAGVDVEIELAKRDGSGDCGFGGKVDGGSNVDLLAKRLDRGHGKRGPISKLLVAFPVRLDKGAEVFVVCGNVDDGWACAQVDGELEIVSVVDFKFDVVFAFTSESKHDG